MTPNRIVAVLTPLVFAPLAGAVSAWLANNVPGAEVSSKSLEEVFIGGALIALAPAAQWLHGWQKYEARQADQESAIELANLANPPASTAPEELEEPIEPEEPDELDAAVESDEFDDLDALDEELFADEQLAESQG
jgi:hypothetical protein